MSLKYYPTASSPKGARLNGGRFNRPNLAALYLGQCPSTAVAEYWRGLEPTPVVLVSWRLTVSRLIDLRSGSLAGDWADWECDWQRVRDEFFGGDQLVDCASWRCGDAAIKGRASGIIYPSRQYPGGSNLVLFTEDFTAGSMEITLIDPAAEILAANPT